MRNVQRLSRKGVDAKRRRNSNLLLNQDEDIVCSYVKAQAGVGAHRVERSSDSTGQKLDAVGAYPHGQWAFNICKASTAKEVIGIDGFDTYTLRMQGINVITGGHTNAIEFCTTMLNAPSLNALLVAYNTQLNQVSSPATLAYPPHRAMVSLRSDDDEDDEDDDLDPYKKLDAAIEASQDD